MNPSICPNCRQENPAGSPRCSACGADLAVPSPEIASAAPALPLPPPPEGLPPSPETPPEEAPPVLRGRRWVWVAAVVLGLVAVGIVAGLVSAHRSGFSFPDTLAGQPRVDSPAFQGFARGLRDMASVGGTAPNIAVYGTDTQPAFLVFFYGVNPGGVSSDFFEGFASGFERSGGTIDLASKQRETRGDITYQCAPYNASSAEGFVCLWDEPQNVGMVMTFFRPAEGPVALAAEVHDGLTD